MRAYGGPNAVGDVVVDGSQDCDLDAVFLHERPRHVDQACVCDTSGVRVQQLLPLRPLRHFAVSTAFGCHGPLPWSGLHTVQAREPDAIASDAECNVTR